jgi:hypothetical protein
MVALIPEYLRPVRATGLMRLGDVLDGGYVLSERAVLESDCLLSMGVSANWEFEKAFLARRRAARRDLLIHAYDHSVDARHLRLYRAKQIARYCLSRDRKFLTNWKMAAGFQTFFDGKTATHFKQRVWRNDDAGSASVSTILSRIPAERQIFVKMDIEGAEYRILGDLARCADRVLGLVIEFHDLDILRPQFEALHTGLAANYDVTHVHVNNAGGLGPDGFPAILEITYERRLAAGGKPSQASRYPLVGVDRPNCLDLPDPELQFV